MTADLKLEKFEGPLDLLLQLIDEEKLNITEVSLSQVTEQFIKYLDKLDGERSEQLADFLVVATKLVYLKSRTLLPYLYPEEEDGPNLADQLKLYRQYVEASKIIEGKWNEGRIAYGRIEPPIKLKEFVLPANAVTDDLRLAFEKLLTRLKPINPLPRVNIDRGLSVKERVVALWEILKSHKSFNFKSVLEKAESRTDVIVTFLAVLDLLKEAKASAQQTSAFGDMEIVKI
ncbi:MAG: hypothetical protein A2538_00815 [Candidatus Magasanikbacteria bacterium RIFOXYD2_FULL_41_14]|uniref:Segregation and condensation protein A n=1 Tax=Candidatus Magasanikbacteria bacterium RIFOXYD2_FULL_41_14 TaxID=1798709 RepID=A0A1F6PEG3_9BACT|nr:MAG: hypothetical protein A2538_00815 [Candidatus Magasanikbacteria bacterium RIFOXYD2_FULL_41_14]